MDSLVAGLLWALLTFGGAWEATGPAGERAIVMLDDDEVVIVVVPPERLEA